MNNSSMKIFDRHAVRLHRERAADGFGSFSFLFREAAERLVDRLFDIRREFPLALDLGSHGGLVADILAGRDCIQSIVQCDLSEKLVRGASGLRIVGDEEVQPFAPATFDLVISSASFHWINDLPGTLVQALRSLRPDGLLLVNFFGGETLKELRRSLLEVESEIKGGVSPRVSPFTDVRDAGALLQRTGFALPVADLETVTVSYESPQKLFHDLRGMGEVNSVIGRQKTFTSRQILLSAFKRYR
ncbi:MAG TPA: methyltransferase domain-containing protein, partial [Rhodospirillales bacterium]|nr:methyltransferase domain-containing protein [Rhodospirillales bacterium]